MAWATIIGAVLTYASQSGGGTDPNQARLMADPFAPYRQDYAAQLNALMQNPSMVQSMPTFQAESQQGQTVLQRALASRGQTGSGAEQKALSDYGIAHQSKAFDDQYSRLLTLSGAGQSPVAGANAYTNANTIANQNASQLAGGVGSAISQYMNSSPQNTTTTQPLVQGGGLQNIVGATPSFQNTSGYNPNTLNTIIQNNLQ